MFDDFSLSTTKLQRIHHGLGRVPTGILLARANRGAFVLGIKERTKEYIEFSVSSQWDLVEEYSVDATATSFDFSEETGYEDGDIRIEGYWKVPSTAGATHLRLRVNGSDSASLSGEGSSTLSLDGSTAANSSIRVAAKSSTSAAEVLVDFDLRNREDDFRHSKSYSMETYGAGTSNQNGHWIGAKWENSSTELHSFGLLSNGSNEILPGSWFRLYRKPVSAKASIWVY